ncbi:MAG: acyl-[ACP]--phospholipid O-acyltransferase, partial [Coxiellaceae bacterium]|nr:acyl-[ACP]--phospholipid O-acyltransferase [Coxiellaceae bacterium]
LLNTRRFLPLFITQFLNAFNDNIFKNSLVILLTYVLAKGTAEHEQMMVTLAAGIFILPFFLFSATAGQLADKFDKAKLSRIIKFFEILCMILGTVGFYLSNTWILMTTLFLMGTHSAFFGPIKYAIVPDHVYEDELIPANALIEASTFLAILLGTLLGGLLIITTYGVQITSTVMISLAIIGWVASFFIPAAPAPQPALKINFNVVKETWNIVGLATHQRDVFLSIMGISWFWLVGGAFLSQFPTFTKEVLHASAPVVSFFLATFSIGIAIGSMACNRLLQGEINAKYAPIALLIVSIFLADVHFATHHMTFAKDAPLLTVGQFLSLGVSWRVLFDFAFLSVAGGIYIVPLYAILQTRAEQNSRARMIACNNIMNAFFMVLTSILIIGLLWIHLSITQIFLFVAIINAAVALYMAKLVPHVILQSVVKWLLVSLYRIKVKGMENYKEVTGRHIIVANHTSFIDALIISAFLPGKITFAINTHIAGQWWLKPFLSLVDAFQIDPTKPMSTKSLIKAVKNGKTVMIFPEGRITVTGSLMKIYEGPGLIADKTGAQVVPIRIEGAQYTPFSRLRGMVKLRWFPKIRLTILPPRTFTIPDDIRGRRRRAYISEQLYDVMTEMLFESSPYNNHLYQALLNAKSIYGGKKVIAEDIERKPLTYRKLIMRSLILGRYLKNSTRTYETVGVLLPNTVNTLTVFFALQAYSRIPAMLNFSSGASAVVKACATASMKKIYTSKRFISLARLEAIDLALKEAGIDVVYLEELVQKISIFTKIAGFLSSLSAKRHFNHYNRESRADDAAVVLFTSGSEGTPKGVVLSHANIQANRFQLGSRIDFSSRDIVMNALPMFHSFGLNAATLLPVLSGIKVFFYPTPLHYRIIPELTYDINATMLFGTDTFLANYGKFCHPYDFYSVRFVVAGAEKLKDNTRQLWNEKLGIRIFEGYGATETSPVLSVNTPMQYKAGSVGRFLPGIEYKLEPVPGIDEGGRLWVKGPNVMLGYMLLDYPGQVLAPKDGWYDTGDVVNVDGQGFVTIIGRVKRFAKVAGEMVSLTAIENIVSSLWPDAKHAVVTQPDDRKGEKLILVTTCEEVDKQSIRNTLKQQQLSELLLPRDIVVMKNIPLLGSGKVDYSATQAAIE